MERMNRAQYFMSMAELASKRSTCVRRQIGAVAVVNDRVVATGYNGPPSGMDHCTKDTCVRILNKIESGTQLEFCRALHAEANLLVQCATSGVNMTDAMVYCTHTPCTSCVKLLLGTRVGILICKEWYPDEYTKELLSLAGYVTKEEWIHRYENKTMFGFVRDDVADFLKNYNPYIVYLRNNPF